MDLRVRVNDELVLDAGAAEGLAAPSWPSTRRRPAGRAGLPAVRSTLASVR
jgi:hypothetical protein